MDASAYAFAHGVRRTRTTLRAWQRTPGAVLGRWVAGSALAATGLLCAVWVVASLDHGYQQILDLEPPFAVGDGADVLSILRRNMLVLALHAMACVAGFIAGSSLPLQAPPRRLTLGTRTRRADRDRLRGGRDRLLVVHAGLRARAHPRRCLRLPRSRARCAAAGGSTARDPRADRAVPAVGRVDSSPVGAGSGISCWPPHL